MSGIERREGRMDIDPRLSEESEDEREREKNGRKKQRKR